MRVKYPRTMHLPWSEGISSDDKVIQNLDSFIGQRVIVTEKMDGESTTMYNDYVHARSLDSRHHPSRDWVKRFQGQVGNDIPDGWRVCGENLYAEHSIGYEGLESYFYVFSIWDDKNMCLSWNETVEYCDMLNLSMVPILYDGIFDEKHIQSLWSEKVRDKQEGYVVRLADSFSYLDFKKSVAKFVRSNHVLEANHHWMFTASEKNKLKV